MPVTKALFFLGYLLITVGIIPMFPEWYAKVAMFGVMLMLAVVLNGTWGIKDDSE